MVLKYIVSIFLLSIFAPDNLTEGPLLINYKSKIKKEIKSISSNEESALTFKNLNLEFHNVEAYSLWDESDQISGYLFIKEVKACSLNGCVAKSKDIDSTLGSEYYDISVLTNKDKVIQSVKVLDYFSDYGYQITSKKYLKKYRGKSLCEFQQNTAQVDGISGATISYNALISSLDEFCELLR